MTQIKKDINKHIQQDNGSAVYAPNCPDGSVLNSVYSKQAEVNEPVYINEANANLQFVT